jgi:hypothetical protein
VTLPHVLVDTSQTPTSTMAISATQSSQTTFTEQTAVVFVPTTQNVAEVEKERKRLLKEFNVFTIIMHMLTLG